jgi:hypothetical protein
MEVSYFVSSCGKTSAHELKYVSNYEDDFGNISQKEINRPEVAHFCTSICPLLITQLATTEQFNLELCWLTKDPWFWLLTTFAGMSVVDCHQHRHHAFLKKTEEEGTRVTNPVFSSKEMDNKMQAEVYNILTCSMNVGSTTRPVTTKQREHGQNIGSAHALTCFLYLNENGQTEYKETVWWCKNWHMPLCKTYVHID